MKTISQWTYNLPCILKLIPKTEDELILLTSMPAIPVRSREGVLTEFNCKCVPECLAVLEEDTILMCSNKGKAYLCKLNSDLEVEKLTTSKCELVHATNYCEDLILLPQNKFLVGSSKNLSIAQYNLQNNLIQHLSTTAHNFDFIANMVSRQQSVLMACLSFQCILWNAEYMKVTFAAKTIEDPIAVEFIDRNIFMCGGYGSGNIYFYDLREKRRVLEMYDQRANRVTCLKQIDGKVFSGTGAPTNKLCLYDVRCMRWAYAIEKMDSQVTSIAKINDRVAVGTRGARVKIMNVV